MAMPSWVLVPRPISSSTIRLRSVAARSTEAVSSISTMNVERPPARSSTAPMRVKMPSTSPIRAAGPARTSPTCASSTISATCRIQVLLPAMFGPVRIDKLIAVAPRHQPGIVRLERPRHLDDRVAPADDLDDVAVVDLGLDPAALGRHDGEREQRVGGGQVAGQIAGRAGRLGGRARSSVSSARASAATALSASASSWACSSSSRVEYRSTF